MDLDSGRVRELEHGEELPPNHIEVTREKAAVLRAMNRKQRRAYASRARKAIAKKRSR